MPLFLKDVHGTSYNPLMRRRWKALVAVGALALFAGLLSLLPPRDDGLDWLRECGGTETVESTSAAYR